MRNLLLGFVFGIFVTSMLAGKSSKAQVQSPQSVKPPTRLYSVVGTGWQTCSDWKATTPSFNTGYIIGHDEAMIQLTQLLRSNPSAADVMQSFDVPAGIKYGDESKSVDNLLTRRNCPADIEPSIETRRFEFFVAKLRQETTKNPDYESQP